MRGGYNCVCVLVRDVAGHEAKGSFANCRLHLRTDCTSHSFAPVVEAKIGVLAQA
jgi:hypothetical protein